MTNRRSLGTGPAPIPADNPQLSPAAPRAVLAAERLAGAVAGPFAVRPAGRRTLSTGPASREGS
ncbi:MULTISPECIES: hypothetical protein [unclassified Streptomyces]|uniref:hypothetical protein n=1 Tax=unclassified Streptomyces TaxID=2593676 RepID=UPI0009649631|nr:hypothetical protein [Streptomyces sp. TSRI0281]OKI37104.1 hypothetical protein A6A29_41095 [Streptomyces sp. TSRI0281]